jgi:glycosyltransferase involved in cell wall biosynthesis
VSWNTISVPPPAGRLGIPFVWGPMGGGQVFPRRYASYIKGHRLTQMIRTVRVRSLPYLPRLRSTVRHASLVLATNDETTTLLRRAGATDVRLFADTGIMPAIVPPEFPHRKAGPWLTVLWAGSLDPWKSLPLALEAMAAVNDLPIRLVVAGDGPMRNEWEMLVTRLGLADRVTFLGRLPWAEMCTHYQNADAFLFTSLKDSFGTVVAEAMGSGLPVLTLDHQGVARFVPDDAGIKVPVTTPDETVAGLADGLRFLQAHPEERAAMGEAAWRSARTLTWDARVHQMSEWYGDITEKTTVSDQSHMDTTRASAPNRLCLL